MICPNFSDNKVKSEFQELINAIDENDAYTFWSRNGGFHLDKTPTGEPSQLFNEILKRVKGDRQEALKIKAEIYKDNFLGTNDWIKRGEEPSIDSIDFLKSDTQSDFFISNLINNQDTFSKENNNIYTQPDRIQYNSNGEVLSPNGNVSKLFKDIEKLEGVTSKEQALQLYEQIRSKEFLDWFGDWITAQRTSDYTNVSKVVDENGEPLVVYHGSPKKFNTFKYGAQGIHFTENINTAKEFFNKAPIEMQQWISETKGIPFRPAENTLYPAFLKINTIKKVEDETSFTDDIDQEEIKKQSDAYKERYGVDGLTYINKVEGTKDKTYIVFEPNQIKSVFNQGTFSKENDNIYYQKKRNNKLPQTEYKKVIALAQKLENLLKIKINIINDENSLFNGKINNKEVTINLAYADISTIVHEVLGHPIINDIKNNNKELYDGLVKKLKTSNKGLKILSDIKEYYSELSNDEQIEEAIVEYLSQLTESELNNTNFFKKLLNKILKIINKLFNSSYTNIPTFEQLSKDLTNYINEVETELIKNIDLIAEDFFKKDKTYYSRLPILETVNGKKGKELLKKKFGETITNTILEYIPSAKVNAKTFINLIDNLLYDKTQIDDLLSKPKNLSKINEEFEKIINPLEKDSKISISDPFELVKKVGYILTEAKTVEDLKEFKRRYDKGYTICTFWHDDGEERFKKSFVLSLHKDYVEDILPYNMLTQEYLHSESKDAEAWRIYLKSKDMYNAETDNYIIPDHPSIKDPYALSEVSVQFSRNPDSDFGRKMVNRYNHAVDSYDGSADYAFENNLDNVVPNLKNSLRNYLGLKLNLSKITYDNNVKIVKDKLFIFKKELNNVYINDNSYLKDDIVTLINKDYQLLSSEGILFDFKNKKVTDIVGVNNISINPLNIKKKDDEIIVETENDIYYIFKIKGNDIISLKSNVTNIGNRFLYYNKSLEIIKLSNVTRIGSSFLYNNQILETIELPNVTSIGSNFLFHNENLKTIELLNVINIGDNFLYKNTILETIKLPKDTETGRNFLHSSNSEVIYKQKQVTQPEIDSILQEFANDLSNRFNIPFKLISEEEAKNIYTNYKEEPAFFDSKTNTAYLVKGKANKTSAIHEIFTHPFLLQIEKTNPKLYANLLKEATSNKDIVDYVDRIYGNKKSSDIYSQLIEDDYFNGNQEKYIKDVDKVSKLIENKLIVKSREFFGKYDTSITDKQEYLEKVFRDLLNNIGIENINSLKELRDKLNNNEIIDSLREKYKKLQIQKEVAYRPINEYIATINLVEYYLKNNDLNKYSETQQTTIKKVLPKLFGENKFKSEKQALAYHKLKYKDIVYKSLNMKRNYLSFYQANAKLEKVERLLNLYTLDSEYFKSSVFNVIKNELQRRERFFDSEKVQNKINAKIAEEKAQEELREIERKKRQEYELNKYKNSTVVERIEGILGGRNIHSLESTMELNNIDVETAIAKNNGNSMDKTYNGEKSELYESILALPEINGNRDLANKVKALLYSDNFLNWFGDWINNPQEASKVVTKQGEPKLVYHGSHNEYSTFSKEKRGSTTGTWKTRKSDSEMSFMFTDDPSVAFFYAIIQRTEKIKQIEYLLGNLTKDNVEILKSKYPSIYSNFLKLKESTSSQEELKNKLLELRKEYSIISDLDLITIGNPNRHFANLQKAINYLINNKEAVKKGSLETTKWKIAVIPNTEIWFYSGNRSINSNGELIGFTNKNINGKNIKDLTDKEYQSVIDDFIKDYTEGYKKLNEKIKAGGFTPKIYPVFLNIRNPNYKDFNKRPFVFQYEDTQEMIHNRTAIGAMYEVADLVEEAYNSEELDGSIIENIADPEISTNYAVFESNQIKSLFNEGTFDNQQDNFYKQANQNTGEEVSQHTLDHEYIARAIDLYVQDELDQQKDKGLIARIKELFAELSNYLKKLFNIPEVFSNSISPNITLRQLAQFAMYGKGKMNLNITQEEINSKQTAPKEYLTKEEIEARIDNTQKEFTYDDNGVIRQYEKVGVNKRYQRKEGDKLVKVKKKVHDLVDSFYRKIFRNPIKGLESSSIDMAHAGTLVDAYRGAITEKFIEDKPVVYSEILKEVKETLKGVEGFDKKTPKYYELSISQFEELVKVQKGLMGRIKEIQHKINPNGEVTFYTQAVLYDKKKDLAGTPDLFVLFSDGSAALYDYKLIFFKQEKYKSIPQYKLDAYELQLSQYAEILVDVYGVNKLREVRILPMEGRLLKDGNFSVRSDFRSDANRSYAEHLEEVPLLNELTGDGIIDEQLDKMFKQRAIMVKKLREGKYRNYILKEKVELMNKAIRKLQLFKDAQWTVTEIADTLKEFDKKKLSLEDMSAEDLTNYTDTLTIYKDFLKKMAVRVLEQGTKEDAEELAKQFNEYNDRIDNALAELRMLDKAYFIRKEGIDPTTSAKAVGWINRQFKLLSDFDRAQVKILSKMVKRVESQVYLSVLEDEKLINEKTNNLKSWAKGNGLSLTDAFKKLIDSKTGNLVKRFSGVYFKERKEASERKNIKWFLENTAIVKSENTESGYDFIDDETRKRFIQNRESKFKEIDANSFTKKQADKLKEMWDMKYHIAIHKEAIFNIKNRYIKMNLNDTNRDRYISEEYKYIEKHKELEEYYEMHTSLITKYSDMTGIDIEDNFVANVNKSIVDLAWQGGKFNFQLVKEAASQSFRAKEHEVVDGEVDPNTGKPIQKIPYLFLNPLYSEVQTKEKEEIVIKLKASGLIEGTEEFEKKYNEEIYELQNEKALLNKSIDLSKSLILFANSSYSYAFYRDNEAAYKSLLRTLQDTKTIIPNSFVSKFSDKFNKALNRVQEFQGVTPAEREVIETFGNYYFYGQKTTEDKPLRLKKNINGEEVRDTYISRNKSIRNFLSAQAIKDLGLSWIVGIGSAIGTSVNLMAKASEEIYFNKQQIKHSLKMLINGDDKAKIILEYINPFGINPIFERANKLSASKTTGIFNINMFFFMIKKPDEMFDKITMLSILQNFGMQDGTITKITEKNKNKVKSFYEAATISENKGLVIPGITDNIDNYVKIRTLNTNVANQIKGTIAYDDIRVASTNIWMAVLMQYKNWIPGLMNDRFKNYKFNDDIGQLDVGRFRILFGEFSGNIVNKLQALKDTLLEVIPLIKYSRYANGKNEERAKLLYKRFLMENPELEDKVSLEDFIDLRKRKLRAMASELRALLGMYLLMMLLRGIAADEDDDPVAYFLENNAYRATNKGLLEISFFLDPNSFLTIAKRPFSFIRTIETTWKAVANTYDELANPKDKRDKAGWFHYSSKLLPTRLVTDFMDFSNQVKLTTQDIIDE